MVGWSLRPAYDEAPTPNVDGGGVLGGAWEEPQLPSAAHDGSSCDRIRSEIERIRREERRLDSRINLQRVERDIRTGESGWPDDVPSGMMPSVFEETVLDLGEQLDVTIDDLDCEKFPCFAVLADTTSETDFDRLREKLDSQCGASLQHYGAVHFQNDGRGSYAVACVPSGENEDIDELKDGLRERAFERLRGSAAGKEP